MSKQIKLDQYFPQLPIKTILENIQETKVQKCDEYLNITLEQFSECTNIKELITADMRDKMPHKFQRKFLLVDKYVKRVYDRYISDSRYREKRLFKNLVFNTKPLYTKRDRDLLKQHRIRKCFVKMYENNILKDIAESCLQNAIKRHGEEMSEAIRRSLPLYIKKILDLYLVKYKTLDRFVRKYKKHSSNIEKVNDNKTPKFTSGVPAGFYSQDLTNSQKMFSTLSNTNCGKEPSNSSHLLKFLTSTQNDDISEPIFLFNADRCNAQEKVDVKTIISYNCAHTHAEPRPKARSSKIWNPDENYERSNVSLINGNRFEHTAEKHFHSNKLNWLEQEFGSDTSKHVIKPLKNELREAIELQIKQQYPNVIENIEEVLNKTLKCVWERITRSMEDRRDILGFIGMQSKSGDFTLKSEMELNVDNTQNLSTESEEVLEELRKNINTPLPKMLTFNEFKEFTNIKEYLYKDIIKKYPFKAEDYLIKIDKYVRKFYKNYILGGDIWPHGICFKSKDFLNKFIEKHKPQKVKCGTDTDIQNITFNASEVTVTNVITSANRKRRYFSQNTNTKSDANIDTNKKQDGNELTEIFFPGLHNSKKELNAPNMHNAYIWINSPPINNGTEIGVDFQSTTENCLTNELNAFGGNGAESGFNNLMVHIPRYADPQLKNYDNGTTGIKVFENATDSFPGSLLSLDCNNLQNQFKGQTSESSFNIKTEIKKEPYIEISRVNKIKESSYLAEGENDVTIVSCKQPEFIYISDETLSCSSLLEDMMQSPPKTVMNPYELPAGFSTCCAESKGELSRTETTSNMNSSHNHSHREQAGEGSSQNILESSKNVFNLLENNPYNSYELVNNDKDKLYNIKLNENNSKSFEKEQSKTDLCLESQKGLREQCSNEKVNNNKISNEQEITISDLKRPISKGKCKTTGASVEMKAKSQQKEKKIKIKAQTFKKKDKTSKIIKHNTIKTPGTDLSNDPVTQKTHNFRPLLLIKKRKKHQQDTVQTISVKQPQNVSLLNRKYHLGDASLVCSIISDKSDASTKVDFLSKDNSYFLSSQLSPKIQVPEPLENATSSFVLEQSEKNSGTPLEGVEIISSSTDWEKNIMKDMNLHIKSPANRQFECITNLFLHQINLKSEINHLNYKSSTPFLQASTWESVQAIITVLTSGFYQLSISAPSLQFLFGITQGEWISFRQILRSLGVFTYNKKLLELETKPLPYRVMYNFFKTIPNFSQVIFEYEDTSINHITCLKFNIKIPQPIINLEQSIDSYILNSIENLKYKLNS